MTDCDGEWKAAGATCARGGTFGPTVVPGTPSAAPVPRPTYGARRGGASSSGDGDGAATAAADVLAFLVAFLLVMVVAVFCLYLKVAGFGRKRAPGDADPAAEMTLQDFQSPPTSPRSPGPVVDGRGDIELPLAGTPSTLV